MWLLNYTITSSNNSIFSLFSSLQNERKCLKHTIQKTCTHVNPLDIVLDVVVVIDVVVCYTITEGKRKRIF